MTMQTMKRTFALALTAALLLSVNAGALFGKKKAPAEAAEGAPSAQESSISTYRGIP